MPEIEQGLTEAAGKQVHVSFTPHLINMSRCARAVVAIVGLGHLITCVHHSVFSPGHDACNGHPQQEVFLRQAMLSLWPVHLRMF